MIDDSEDSHPAIVATVGNGRADELKTSTATPVVPEFRAAYHAEYEFRRGPLPSPTELQGYEQVLPGLADRIVNMAETEGHQRRSRAQYRLQTERIALYVSSALALAFFVGCFYLIAHGKEIGGLGSAIAGLATLVTAFIVGKRSNVKIAEALSEAANGVADDDNAEAKGTRESGAEVIDESAQNPT